MSSAQEAWNVANRMNRGKLQELYSVLQEEAELREHIDAGELHDYVAEPECWTCADTGSVAVDFATSTADVQCPNCPAGDRS